MLVYDLILLLLFVPSLLVFVFTQRRRLRGEFLYRWRERLGIWGPDDGFFGGDDARPLLWLHCASLGEVRAAEPLLREFGGYRVLLTTLTLSGRAYAEKNRLGDRVFFLPLDFHFVMRRLVRRIRPAAVLLVETELWPGLLKAASDAGARVVLVNGRISVRSYRYYSLMKPFWSRVLKKFSVIAARSREDADRFRALGCPGERIVLTGNIKYDRSFPIPDVSDEEIVPPGMRLFVAGSTREGEEGVVLDAWLAVRREFRNLVLVIAPRHLNRVPDVVRSVRERGVEYALWSSRTKASYECLVIDTFGELLKFYAMSEVAFVGGSLAGKGGQNPIEPAAYAKPVLFGPSMQNFQTEAHLLEGMQGGFTVRSGDELAMRLKMLMEDDHYRRETGRKAYRSVESQKGALGRTVELIRNTVR